MKIRASEGSEFLNLENKMENNCVRCGHSWFSRKWARPRNCARCKAFYWYRPARIPKHYGQPRPVGRQYKYPVNTLEVGQKMIFPCNLLPDGSTDVRKNIGRYAAIMRYQKKSGRKFWIEATYKGLEVTRTS